MPDPHDAHAAIPRSAIQAIAAIDGVRVFSPTFERYVNPQTVGKMTVREACKGPLKRGTQLNNILQLNNGRRPTDPKCVHAESIGGVTLEVGKEYAVFLRSQQSSDGTFHEYAIDGFQFGLREVKGAGADAAVLNNETQKWEHRKAGLTLTPSDFSSSAAPAGSRDPAEKSGPAGSRDRAEKSGPAGWGADKVRLAPGAGKDRAAPAGPEAVLDRGAGAAARGLGCSVRLGYGSWSYATPHQLETEPPKAAGRRRASGPVASRDTQEKRS